MSSISALIVFEGKPMIRHGAKTLALQDACSARLKPRPFKALVL